MALQKIYHFEQCQMLSDVRVITLPALHSRIYQSYVTMWFKPLIGPNIRFSVDRIKVSPMTLYHHFFSPHPNEACSNYNTYDHVM